MVFLTCSAQVRRSSITHALARIGVGVATQLDSPSLVHITAEARRLTVRHADEVLLELSVALEAEDVAALAKVAVELASLREIAHAVEDTDSVGVIASLVAHDARNALVPVVYAANVLVSQAPASLAEVARVLDDGSHRVANILRRIVSIAPEAPERVDVNRVIAELSGTLHTMTNGCAQLTTRLESPLPAVQLSRAAIERILLNLIANARDACKRYGRIVVSTSRRNGSIVIGVEDNGVGMDEQTRARALQPFFTTKGHDLGRGLGLASVARTVRSAGGRVVISSSQELG